MYPNQKITTALPLLYAREALYRLFRAEGYTSEEGGANPDKTINRWLQAKKALIDSLPFSSITVPAIPLTEPLIQWAKNNGIGQWELLSGYWPLIPDTKKLPCPPSCGTEYHPQSQSHPANVCKQLILEKAEGNCLIFSILPHDILACSEEGNEFGEVSCYRPNGGEYAAAPAALLNQPDTAIVTIRASDETLLAREWVYLSDNLLSFAEGRAYGTFKGSNGLRKSARVLIEHVLSTTTKTMDSWKSVEGTARDEISPNNGKFRFIGCTGLYQSDGIRSITRHVSQPEHCLIEIRDATPFCLHCGTIGENEQESPFCSDCQGNENRSVCCSCGDRLNDDDDVFVFGDSIYCESCYSDNTSDCEHCDETVAADEIQGIEIYSPRTGRMESMTVCDYCRRNSYTECEHCSDTYVRDGEGIDVDGSVWCPLCVENEATLCEECNEYTENPKAVYKRGSEVPVCSDCFDEKEHPEECDKCGIHHSDPDYCPNCCRLNVEKIPLLPGIEAVVHDGP